MATLKLKKTTGKSATAPAKPDRAPLRGSSVQKRPTLAQAQAHRAEREARYQEQLRQRFGDEPPAQFKRRDESPAPTGERPARPARGEPTAPQARPAHPAPQGRPAREARPSRPPLPPAQRSAPGRPPAPPRSGPSGPNTAFGSRPPARPRFEDDEDDAPSVVHAEKPGSLRLSKRMSELGIASRREADEWIPKGWVRVDDKVVKELGSRVMPDQRITIDAAARHQQAQRVTVLVHKPVGYVSGQAEDGYEPASVLVTPENQWREDRSGIRYLPTHLRNLAPAGRLDIDSVGLLVLTQDGRIAKQLIGEDSEVDKEYLVRVKFKGEGRLPDADLALLRHGLELDGEPLREALVEWANDDQLRFVLREGKKRQIRRMCEAVGLEVLGLKRVRIGRVMLGDLPAGQWRYLRPGEVF